MDQQTAQAIASLRQEIAALTDPVKGMPWLPLAVPPGATGTAQYRSQAGGLLALNVCLSWHAAPGTVALSGVHRGLWPVRPWTDGTVSVDVNGMITIEVTGARLSAMVLVPVT